MIPSGQRGVWGKLSVRIALMLAVALLPLSIVSLVQTWSLKDEARARIDAVLLGETLRAASREVATLNEVQGMVSVLASAVSAGGDDTSTCVALMQSAVAMAPVAAVAGFVREDGTMICSSTGQVHAFADDPTFRQLVGARAPAFYVNPVGPVSGTSILGLSHPVFRDGTYIGYVGVSLRHDRMIALDRENFSTGDPGGQELLAFWTFDSAGNVLTASVGLDDVTSYLPANRPLTGVVDRAPWVFDDLAPDGTARSFAVVPLPENQLYLMSSWSVPETAWNSDAQLSPYLPTILMFTLGLIIAAYSAEILVTRHVRLLQNSFGSFTRGERRLEDVDLLGAPDELQQLGEAYQAMTESVTRGEARLEDNVHQKEVLLREVHHRVKNNLQLISSIMSIQMRRAQSDEAKILLKALQDRVISLATIHRELYQTSGLADVRADELFPDIVRQIISVSTGADQPFRLDSEFDDLRLVPDQAVPLSLLLAEALTNALKHSQASYAEPGRIRVRLKRVGGSQAVLEVTNKSQGASSYPPPAGSRHQGVGSQLMTAFATQLSGTLETDSAADYYSIRLTFTVAPLAEGEDRTQAVA